MRAAALVFSAVSVSVAAPASLNAGAAELGPALQCIGSAIEVQDVRDKLEVAAAYLIASRDNFGPGRQRAIARTRDAVVEFERLHGEPHLAPTPGTETAQYLGARLHPRMSRALTALKDVKRRLDQPGCERDVRLEALRQAVVKAISGIGDAFSFNPAGGGRR